MNESNDLIKDFTEALMKIKEQKEKLNELYDSARGSGVQHQLRQLISNLDYDLLNETNQAWSSSSWCL